MHQDHIRTALSRILQSPVRDELWDYLEEMAFVEEVEVGAEDINLLADRARQVIRAGGGGPMGAPAPRVLKKKDTNTQGQELSVLRPLALSLLIAQRANKDPMVRSFREEVLGGELLAYEDVERWVREQSEKDGPSSFWITMPANVDIEGVIRTKMPQGMSEDFKESFAEGIPWSPVPKGGLIDDNFELRYLEYGTPDKMWTRIQAIAAGGVLERLLTLTERLIDPVPSLESPTPSYPWTLGQAAVFVLAELAPFVDPIKYKVNDSPYLRGATRIVLDIDPTATPDEVAAKYRSVRDRILSRRPRTMSAKHLRLAMFAAERPDNETWDEKRHGWNRACPEPLYPGYNYGPEDRRNFHRHVVEACDRLLDPGFQTLSNESPARS